LTTRDASRTACAGSSANWKALKPTAALNVLSSKGRASMPPVTKSASGTRSRAISMSSGVMSIPVTVAPSAAAMRAA
jgi:hypothetical protein